MGATKAEPVDVRLLSATHRDLDAAMAQGQFREDLYYRLDVVSLSLPRLDERREDIPLLLDHFNRVKARENSISPKAFAPEAVDCFMTYPWPGNVRELENLIERLTILTPNETVTLSDLPPAMRSQDQWAALREEVLKGSCPLSDAVDEFERELILKALQRSGFNRTKAASLLGTSRRVLRYRMEKLNIAENDLGDDQSNLSKS